MSKYLSKEHRAKLSKARLERKKRLGFLNSPETREKMRLAKLGNKNRAGKIGQKHTTETKEKISKKMRGKNNHQWKGGKKSLTRRIRWCVKYKEWKMLVFERDKNQCRICKTKEKLEPHHIIPLRVILKKNNIQTIEEALNCDELWNIDNGITLCDKHHSETDVCRKIMFRS